jgi:hypothetical protein
LETHHRLVAPWARGGAQRHTTDTFPRDTPETHHGDTPVSRNIVQATQNVRPPRQILPPRKAFNPPSTHFNRPAHPSGLARLVLKPGMGQAGPAPREVFLVFQTTKRCLWCEHIGHVGGRLNSESLGPGLRLRRTSSLAGIGCQTLFVKNAGPLKSLMSLMRTTIGLLLDGGTH